MLGDGLVNLARWRWPLCAAMVVSLLVARVVGNRLTTMMVCLCSMSAGAWAWHAPPPAAEGPCGGVATLRSDPTWRGAAASVIIELGGVRHRVHAYGPPARRLAQRASGESVHVRGMCAPLDGDHARWDRINHVLARFDPHHVSGNHGEGSRFIRAANRIRAAMERGSSRMPAERRALFLGLVIGDDRAQSDEMRQRFRDSGLSHLTAVSGQNVAFLLILVHPLTRGRGRVAAWMITMGVIAWFVVVTRAEPSIVRASVMAATAATMTSLRVEPDTRRILAWTVIALLMVDPMLAWSTGFALSVGATCGLAWWAPWWREVLGCGGTMSATVAAQMGTLPVMLLVFGAVPVAAFATNPLAVPVAGLVMTLGLPMTIVAAAAPPLQPMVGAILAVPVGCIDAVATVGAWASPSGGWSLAAWSVPAGWVMWRLRRRRPRGAGGVAG